MKLHKYTLLLLVLFVFGSAKAQKGFHLGLHGGLNNVSLVDQNKFGDVEYEYDMKLGSTLGFVGGFNFTHLMGIQVEANWAEAGQRFIMAKNGAWEEKDISLSYFQIPVMLKLTGGAHKVRFTAMAGPQWGFLNKATIHTVSDSTGITDEDAKSRFAKTDFGFVVAGGSEFALAGNFFGSAQLRFNYGISSLNPDDLNVVLAGDEADLHNVAIGIYVGVHYMFPAAE
ncbi:MAG: PorT family protein [Bacteroidota bacterium]|nr:PorT family protein [Bacteroidota bacterium]